MTDPATHGTSFTYQARIVDAAGNVGTTASQAVTIDTAAPTAPSNHRDRRRQPAAASSDFIASDTTLVVSGTQRGGRRARR